MRTVTFKSVLHGVAMARGLDPSLDLTDELALKYTEFINNRVRESLEWAMWPELMLIERRAYRPSWSSATTYAIGDERFYEVDEKYYTALTVNTNKPPSTNPSDWEISEDLNRYVSYEPPTGSGLTNIGTPVAISDRDPRLTDSPAYRKFWLSKDGLQVEPAAPARVYVEFRIRPPTFESRLWVSTTTYAAGAIRYVDSTGECYLALQASTGRDPTTETAYWRKIDLPYVLALYVKLAAYADALADDGQTDKAESVRGDTDNPRPGTAYFELERLADVEMAQAGQYMAAEYVGR